MLRSAGVGSIREDDPPRRVRRVLSAVGWWVGGLLLWVMLTLGWAGQRRRLTAAQLRRPESAIGRADIELAVNRDLPGWWRAMSWAALNGSMVARQEIAFASPADAEPPTLESLWIAAVARGRPVPRSAGMGTTRSNGSMISVEDATLIAQYRQGETNVDLDEVLGRLSELNIDQGVGLASAIRSGGLPLALSAKDVYARVATFRACGDQMIEKCLTDGYGRPHAFVWNVASKLIERREQA